MTTDNTTELLARWEARALNAAPVDSMIVNRHIRELREALAAPAVKDSLTAAQPSPAAVERKPLTNFVMADQFTSEPHTDDVFAAYQQGIRFAERYYGITAQQGEKT